MAIRWTDTTPVDRLPVLAGPVADTAKVPAADPFGDTGLPAVCIAAEVDRQVREHLAGGLVERGGLLIGTAWRGAGSDRPVRIDIRRAIAAEATDASGISLRMDAAVWTAARAALAAGERVVGWYHSHPGLTAFFSDTDRATQRAFFHHAYSVGWVIDPLRGEEALFVGADCRPARRSVP